MLISFWLCLFVIKLYSRNDIFKYRKYFMKIRFESDDDLYLGKTFDILEMIIVTATILEKSGKYYPQMFLDKCLSEL